MAILLLWTHVRREAARLFYLSPNEENPLNSADKAVELNPDDPNAHFIRAGVLMSRGESAPAIRELESAVALRPRDFSLWLMLGDWRLQIKDEERARQAYLNALHLAPYYSEPHRALGNLFRAQGRFNDAYREFRAAVAINPSLLSEIISNAVEDFHNDGAAILQAVQPLSSSDRLLLVNTLFNKGATAEAVSLFHSAGEFDAGDRRIFVAKLLDAKLFDKAFEIWARLSPGGNIDQKYLGVITNSGFESPIDLDDVGFGWQIPGDLKNVRIKLDGINVCDGASSLRLDFNGKYETPVHIVSQLVLIEPQAKYRLTFGVRTEELVTGAPPVVTVTDAADGSSLARSSEIPEKTNGWQEFSVDFTTAEKTRAVLIAIQREGNGSSAYPIFGRMWIDKFALEKLSGAKSRPSLN